jgi:hypothetical protein
MRGESVSGDRATVHVSGTRTVLATIDGLGHGPEAATAAQLAATVIEHNPAEPLDVLMLLAHREMADTRGAAATVAILDGETSTMSWLGVGNVDGVLIRADRDARPHSHGVFLVGGVLGYHMGRLHLPDPVMLAEGDVVVLASDGVRANLAEVVQPDVPVERLADMIIAKYARIDDDATVLAARYQPLDPDDDRLRDEPSFRPLNPLAERLGDRPPFGRLGPSSGS